MLARRLLDLPNLPHPQVVVLEETALESQLVAPLPQLAPSLVMGAVARVELPWVQHPEAVSVAVLMEVLLVSVLALAMVLALMVLALLGLQQVAMVESSVWASAARPAWRVEAPAAVRCRSSACRE
jgi:hypothetical protein